MALFITILGLYGVVVLLALFLCVRSISRHRRFNGKMLRLVFSVIFLFLSVTPFIGIAVQGVAMRRFFYKVSNLWLGFGIYLFMISVLVAIILLLFPKLRKRLSDKFWEKFIAIALICVGFMIFGNIHYKQVKKVTYNISAQAPAAYENGAATTKKLKIAFVADTHLGSWIGSSQMEKMVTIINAMKPDIVLMGGDIFDSDYDMLKNPSEVIAVLKRIRSKYGTYGVYGNHDIKEKLIGGFSANPTKEAFRDPRMAAFMEKSRIHMLNDEVLKLGKGDLVLAGRFDGMKIGNRLVRRKTAKELLEKVNPRSSVIVMEHEPMEFNAFKKLGVKLVLSGHTHAGQFFPFNIPQPFIWENAYGLKKFGDMHSVVTSGVGLYGPPLRIGTDSEVVEINFSYKSYKK